MKKLLIFLAVIAVCDAAKAQSFSSYVWEQKAKYGDTVKSETESGAFAKKHKHNKNCPSHLGITTHPAKYREDRETIERKYDDKK